MLKLSIFVVDMNDVRLHYIYEAGICAENISVFARRLEGGEITCGMTYADFLADRDTYEVVRLLRMDVDKFWHLVLFAYDYATDLCSHGVDEEDGGYDMMWTLIERGRRLVNNETPEPLRVDASCTFKLQGRSYRVRNADSIAVLLYWIHRGMIHMEETHPIWELNWLIDDYDRHVSERRASQSVAIWCFASIINRFFKTNSQFRGRAQRDSDLSLNKLLLISRLIYKLGMSDNDNFLYSDDTIKGFMRQYKSYILPDRGEYYTKIVL